MSLKEAKQKEKAYFKQIVAANNVLRRMPQVRTVYCGACGQRLKVALSRRVRGDLSCGQPKRLSVLWLLWRRRVC